MIGAAPNKTQAGGTRSSESGAPRPLVDPRKPRERRWPLWGGILIAVTLLGLASRYASRPAIGLVHPQWRNAMETLAVSGLVEGHAETTIAADAQGTLVELLVDENDIVRRGQLLARLQDRTGEGQVAQLQASLDRARAQLRQAQLGATRPQIRGASSRMLQADEGGTRATAALASARIAEESADSALAQAGATLERARAAVQQAVSQRDLADKTLARTKRLVAAGALPGQRLDQDQSVFEVADAGLADARASVASAQAGLRQAQLSREAARAAFLQAQSDVRSSEASARAARADLDNLRILPLPENVEVARAQVREAEAALQASRSTVRNAEIRAPYDGTVVEILCRPGGNVTGQGLLRLVETGRLEAKADIDESNLRSLRPGERATLATAAAPDHPIDARVIRVSSHVDSTHGTVQVAAIPVRHDVRLTAGQTVDLTIVTSENARRLVVPITAVRKRGDENDVFVYRDGTVKSVPVIVGQASTKEVAILSGVSERDLLARDAGTLTDGQAVRLSDR
jgi:multidrug resistance efflux pump